MSFYYMSLMLVTTSFYTNIAVPLAQVTQQNNGLVSDQGVHNPVGTFDFQNQNLNEPSIRKTKKRSIPETDERTSEAKTNLDYTTTTPVNNDSDSSPKYLCEIDAIEPVGPACANRSVNYMSYMYTCESRCNDPMMECGAYMGPYCSCHPLCLVSHDCCQDFQQFCPEHYKIGERKRDIFASAANSSAYVECMNPFSKKEKDYTFWMVGHCPLDNVNQTVWDKCEGEITEFIQIVPVVSRATDVTYKNYFCATCNNILDVIPWGLNVTCNEVWEGSLNSPQELLDLVDNGACDLEYKPPVEHICVDKYMRQPDCTPQSTGCLPKYADLCYYGFQMPVAMGISEKSFKNVYCLMCAVLEGFPLDDISCDFWGDESAIVTPIQGELAKFSFGILVDYNPSAGNKVGFIFKDDIKTFGCGLADSENLDCVSYCADGFQYTNGKCVLKYHTFAMTITGWWSMPNYWLIENTDYWKILKKTLIELFLEVLEPCIVEEIKLKAIDDRDPLIHFDITSKYKLKVENRIPLDEIHTTFFNNILKETISAHPKRTQEILDLHEVCLSLFGEKSCWNYGCVTKSSEIIGGDFVSRNESNNNNQSAIAISIPRMTYNTTDCPRKPVNPNSVEILTNGSIVSIDTGNLLSEDEFLLVGNMVYVCVNESVEFDNLTAVWKYDDTMGLLTIICTTLSLVCMFIRLILQPFVPLFQNFPGKLQFLFILSLFLASLLFLIGPNCIHIKELCITLGVLIHWSYLAVFTWTVIIARDMFYIFSPSSFAKSTDTNVSVLKRYTLLAWGVPAVIVAISLGLDFSNIDPAFKPMYGRGICWISQRYPLLIFFTIPIAISILVNIGFFIPTAISLWKSMKQRVLSTNKTSEYPFGIYAKLFCLMGFTWIFAFIAPYNIALWYIFIVLNASQGVFIFLAFVLRKQVWDSLTFSKDSKKSNTKTISSYLSPKSTTSEQNGLTNQQDRDMGQSPKVSEDEESKAVMNKDNSVKLDLSGEITNAIEMKRGMDMKGQMQKWRCHEL
ncbi:unnamed protein product [Owenia fusiformis]|uniref:Uncharacterized protein n=1 Tax=Owenia fusiformis TaxID=6347 RepID=A0A8S4NKM4_OWEFU|nr:unnamed protein product [Owenia fusiformis]